MTKAIFCDSDQEEKPRAVFTPFFLFLFYFKFKFVLL